MGKLDPEIFEVHHNDEWHFVYWWAEKDTIKVDDGDPTSIENGWTNWWEILVHLDEIPLDPDLLASMLNAPLGYNGTLGQEREFLVALPERADWETLAPVVARHFNLPEDLPADWVSEVL
jgi:hypothetical protein